MGSKNLLLLFLILVFRLTPILGQSVLEFKVVQPEALIADAGKDSAVLIGTKITLGGQTPAKGGRGSYTYSWSPASGLDSATKPNPVAKIDSTITYTLTVKDQFCTSISKVTITANSVTGLPDIAVEAGLKIFPNPNYGNLYIVSQKGLGEKDLTIQILDLTGKVIFTKKTNGMFRLNEQIQTPRGRGSIYILRIYGGSLNISQKINIQ